MAPLDYIVITLYFLGLLAVGFVVKGRIRNSEDMFIAGRNSSWWLSGISAYMTIFSASTFVVWGGVAYKSGLVATIVAYMFTVSSLIVGKWIAGKWRSLRIKSPGEFLSIRFGKATVNFYTISGIIGRGIHTAVAMYAVAVVMCALINVPEGSFLASTGAPGDAPQGNLSIWWALLILGVITLTYTVLGGFLAVLMTDVIQFGVLLCVVIFMIPLSLNAVGGLDVFIEKASAIPGFFSCTSPTYTWTWLILWIFLNVASVGGDWPFVQRYISVPTVRDAKKSSYLVAILYILTPLIWYLPAMIYRVMVPGPGIDVDPETMTALGEGAYVNMSKMVLMKGMVGMMLAAMLSATMSNVSGNLNVYANVFTYQIWDPAHKSATEKQRMRAGRIFTLIFGLSILGVSMLIPFAGGAEKVVVALLTMVLCPLYIPSIWGLFSRRLTGKQLIWAMLSTWIIGFTLKFTIPSHIIRPTLIESVSGCILPVAILSVMEIVSRHRGFQCDGYHKIQQLIDSDADGTASVQAGIAARNYSRLAIGCFCITIGAIALLLSLLLITGDPFTLKVKGIVLRFIAALSAIIATYLIYRFISHYRNNAKRTEQWKRI